MIKKIFKVVVIYVAVFIVFSSILLMILNPDRGNFNHTVFESHSITENQEIMKDIRNINLKDYNNDNHPLIKRRKYIFYSIYDVHVSDTKVYHILGILESFKLLNG